MNNQESSQAVADFDPNVEIAARHLSQALLSDYISLSLSIYIYMYAYIYIYISLYIYMFTYIICIHIQCEPRLPPPSPVQSPPHELF